MTTPTPSDDSTAPPATGSAATADGPAVPAARPGPAGKPDLASLAAAMRSIERGESPAAPAPRGDAAEARRKRREAMAEETARLQALEAAEAVPAGGSAAPDADADAGPSAPDAVDGDPEPAPAPATDAGGTGDDDGESPHSDPAAPEGTDSAEVDARGREPSSSGPLGKEAAGAVRERPEPRSAAAGAAVRGPLDAVAVAAAREVLAGGGAPGELAEPVVRALGEGAAELVRADPWSVLGLPGVRVGVEQVDAFARAVLGEAVGPGDERRVRALVSHVLDRAAEQGHTALGADTLRTALARYSVPDPDAGLAAAVEEGRVLAFREAPEGAEGAAQHAGDAEGGEDDADGEDGEPAPVRLLFGLDRYALAEESLADGCVRLLRSFEGPREDEAPGWEAAAAAAPSPSAAELIRAAAASGLVLHTGGEAARAEPAALVAAARAAGLRAYAAAYTDSGRRRLAEVPGIGAEGARTVVELLAGGRSADGSLPLDLLAVLDAPQLSVEEAATLVEAVPDGARLVLSGDPHTLWSAGPGRAFADLLASKAFPRVTSRTPDPGPIGELTSYVAVGELAAVEAPGKEVVVVPVRAPGEAVHRAVQLVADSVPRAFGVPPGDTQVITLAHGGPVGTRALNAALKERLNPGPGRFGGFDPGDRVVHVPAPGRTYPATVVGADQEGLRLAGADGPVLVPRAEVGATVRHGWAVTGHQAAGIRWPAAVVVVPGDAGPLLTCGWVYTAFSRGERHLSVVQGADQALAAAVAGPVAKERTTRLAAVLRELAAQ
ncbi:helix-hairpin-helix domain-containing protein [Actinacidiphila sp. bgisy145]|uniref:helix-hairpin-helix domain-containing protein n=1 Tax=Actinacidiphila sp. bgisy145 TaxID=3413792 RepID=UPI003EBADB03